MLSYFGIIGAAAWKSSLPWSYRLGSGAEVGLPPTSERAENDRDEVSLGYIG
jgi:hypothetical protein